MMNPLNTLFQTLIDQADVPGVQYAIIDEKGIHLDALGHKRLLPYKEALHGDEIYDVASLTKVIVTTTLIMKLIEDGTIDVMDAISEVLPQFRHKHITYHDLLTHSSGLPADIPRASTLKNRQSVIDHVLHVDLSYETGKHIVYSDIGFILLGLAIEKLYHRPLDVIAEEVIFKPLGMHDSSFRPPSSRCAPTEYRNDDVFQGFLEGKVHDEKSFAMGGISGHAGLFSTAKDIAIFIDAILKNNHVLKPSTLDALFIPRVSLNGLNGQPLIRAYGWDKPQPMGSAGEHADFMQTILHTGFTGCNMWIDRKHHLGFVLLSNDVHPTRANKGLLPLRHTIANIVFERKV